MFVAANKGSYVANAGKSRHLTDAFKYANAFSFNPFDTVKSGMKAKAAKDIAKTKYDAQKDYYAQTGQAELDGAAKYNQAAQYAQGQQRMAGMLGALGGLAYAGAKWKYNKDNPLEPPEKRESADNSEYFDSIQDQITTLQESIAASSKITSQTIPSTAELLEQSKTSGGVQSQSSSTSTATSSTPASAPGGATATKPVAFAGGGAGWGALGSTIKFAEGTWRQGEKAYNTGFGYNMFDDLSKHPDKVFNNTSAAAGAYQFMPKTWETVVQPALKLPDFGKESQEKAGEFLVQNRGVKTDKTFTTVAELRSAFDKLAPEWASIPLSSTGKSYYDGDGINSAKPFETLRKFYEQQVGYTLK